ncbi:MAG: hypothetical protein ACE5H3_07640, partial [Planctomycetota bacterium]
GAEVRGAVPVNDARVTYVVWVGNGGALINDDPALLGSFRFNNFEDVDNNKHVGTRIGVVPIPGVEVGASLLKGSVSGAKTSSRDVGTTVWGVDFTLNQEVKPIGGRVRVDAELIKSNVETVTFLKKGIGPMRFNNDRSGGYAQLAYRPTLADSTVVSNTEAVFRYDWQSFPIGAPMNMDLGRATFGLDYWVSPATVLKIAVDRLFVQGGQNVMSFYFQIALGV